MAVSGWAVLGIVLILLSLPFAYLASLPNATGGEGLASGLGLGAGVAFVIVAAGRAISGSEDDRTALEAETAPASGSGDPDRSG